MNKFACGKSALRACAKGFTLAEVMIVLVVIGVITGILLPTAIQSTPDKNVMKFKKGYNTLGQVIRELVTSDKYYKDGDLGIRANGELIDGTHDGDATYFCETFADVVNIKSKNCYEFFHTTPYVDLSFYNGVVGDYSYNLDAACKYLSDIKVQYEIELNDGIFFVQTASKDTFGISMKDSHSLQGSTTETTYRNYHYTGSDKNNNISDFFAIYKIFCMDVDGIGKGEDPFGFGIRVDGKILPGARADEWINKSIQKEE